MRKGSIKNYDIYFNKLLDFAKLCEVKVYFTELKETEEEKDLGEYLYTARSINLNSSMTEKETIAILLHELGHFIDHKFNKRSLSTERAYDRLNNNLAITPKQKELIVACERKAWEYGRGIAKMFNIPLGTWFEVEYLAGLSGYQSLKTN